MPGDRKSIQDAAPARDPNLTFSFGEAFEKLVEELKLDPRREGEFTSKEFGARIGKNKTQYSCILQKLIKEGRVERRSSGRQYFYRVIE